MSPILLFVVLAACRPTAPPADYQRLAVGTMTPDDQRDYVATSLVEMRDAEVRLAEMKRRDAVCVQEHLSAVTALVVVASVAESELQRFIVVGDAARADGEVRKVALALGELREVAAHANGCAWLDPAPPVEDIRCWRCGPTGP